MRKIEDLKIVIAVDMKGLGVILKMPEGFEHLMDGNFCEDNLFENVPDKCGVYECDVEYWFSQGYMDGYPAPGESDWKFIVANYKTLVDLSEENN